MAPACVRRRGHLCHCTVRACFEIYCASRGGPCDSVALVIVEILLSTANQLSEFLLEDIIVIPANTVFTARCTIVQSAVMQLHVVRLSARPSVCLYVTLVAQDHIGWNKNFNEDRPILSEAECRSMILVSRNVRYMLIFAWVPRASNTINVIILASTRMRLLAINRHYVL